MAAPRSHEDELLRGARLYTFRKYRACRLRVVGGAGHHLNSGKEAPDRVLDLLKAHRPRLGLPVAGSAVGCDASD
jgi:hypothetical protein